MAELQVKEINLQRHVSVNENLCPVVFETEDRLFDTVRDGLLRIAEFWWKQAVKIFPDFKQRDFVIYGDLVGYVYNPFSEASIGVIADISPACLDYLEQINDTFVTTEFRYKFINRPVHCRLLPSVPEGIAFYSLKTQGWINRPVRRQFDFDNRDLCLAFASYQDAVHDYVRTLSKLDNGLLDIAGCHALEKYLRQAQQKAQNAWRNSPQHEYHQDYLLWRTFREVGGLRYFNKYLSDSYNYNINELEQC